MKITVLVDNNTLIDRYYLAEPALSFLLEDNGREILFDTGYSDVLVRNAEAMGIDLSQINAIVLSHGHNDHTGGLRHLSFLRQDIDLYCHPDVFLPKSYQGQDVGCPVKLSELNDNFHVHLQKEPLWLSDELLYLGEIERKVTDNPGLEADPLKDDTALAYCREGKLSIITGCSHSGICNIIDQARRLTGLDEVDALIGGFHLLQDPEQTEQVCRYLETLKPERAYPCHCTDLEAKIALSRLTKVQEVGVSLTIEV